MSASRLYIPPGKRFGELTVIREGPPVITSKLPRRTMICSCSCGTAEVQVRVDTITRGRTKSCGCLRKEAGKRAAQASVTHGMRNHHLYPVWLGLRRRAKDRRSADYESGIHEPWLVSPAVFVQEVEAEIGPRPEPGAVFTRCDDDGDFVPGNIKWITRAQHLQRRRSVNRLSDRIDALERENRRLLALVETLRGEVEMYQLYGS
jgi:hypothetical protein